MKDDGMSAKMIMSQFIEFLERKESIEVEGIYRISASTKSVRELREELERAKTADILTSKTHSDVFTVAQVFKQWIRDLYEGVIPVKNFDLFVHADTRHTLRDALTALPAPHRTLLTLLLHHLARVAKHAEQNRMSAGNLAVVFGPNIVGSGVEGEQQGDEGFRVIGATRVVKDLVEMWMRMDERDEDVRKDDDEEDDELTDEKIPRMGDDGSHSTLLASSASRELRQRQRRPPVSESSYDEEDSTGLSTPTSSSSAHPSPTLSERAIVNAAVKASIGAILFNKTLPPPPSRPAPAPMTSPKVKVPGVPGLQAVPYLDELKVKLQREQDNNRNDDKADDETDEDDEDEEKEDVSSVNSYGARSTQSEREYNDEFSDVSDQERNNDTERDVEEEEEDTTKSVDKNVDMEVVERDAVCDFNRFSPIREKKEGKMLLSSLTSSRPTPEYQRRAPTAETLMSKFSSREESPSSAFDLIASPHVISPIASTSGNKSSGIKNNNHWSNKSINSSDGKWESPSTSSPLSLKKITTPTTTTTVITTSMIPPPPSRAAPPTPSKDALVPTVKTLRTVASVVKGRTSMTTGRGDPTCDVGLDGLQSLEDDEDESSEDRMAVSSALPSLASLRGKEVICGDSNDRPSSSGAPIENSKLKHETHYQQHRVRDDMRSKTVDKHNDDDDDDDLNKPKEPLHEIRKIREFKSRDLSSVPSTRDSGDSRGGDHRRSFDQGVEGNNDCGDDEDRLYKRRQRKQLEFHRHVDRQSKQSHSSSGSGSGGDDDVANVASTSQKTLSSSSSMKSRSDLNHDGKTLKLDTTKTTTIPPTSRLRQSLHDRKDAATQQQETYSPHQNYCQQNPKDVAEKLEELRLLKKSIREILALGGKATREQKERYRTLSAFAKANPISRKSQSDPTSTSHTVASSQQRSNSLSSPKDPSRLERRINRPQANQYEEEEKDSMVLVLKEKERIKMKLTNLKARFLSNSPGDGGEKPTSKDKVMMRKLYNRYCELKEELSKRYQTKSLSSLNLSSGTSQSLLALKREKRQLQIRLHAFQDEFYRKQGRPIQSAADRRPMEKEYRRYQLLRAELSRMSAS